VIIESQFPLLKTTVHEPAATIEMEKGEIAGTMNDLFRAMFEIMRRERMVFQKVLHLAWPKLGSSG
jgi:hypothetical protein